VSALLDRITPRPSRRELMWVIAAVVLALAIRIVYVLATKDHALAGDELEYDLEAKLAADGHWLQTTTPYGDAHASVWKAPGYPVFLSVLYTIFGTTAWHAILVQVIVFTPISIGVTWLLGRSLFGVTAGVLAALLLAVYPNAWQYDVGLYSEVIATPLGIAMLLAVFTTKELTWRRVATVGVMLGLLLLIKPAAILWVAGIAVVWWSLRGLRAGTAWIAATVAIAVLVVAPYSIRNATLEGPWVPLSLQTAAGYGTFNDDAALDGSHPWAWRPETKRDRQLFKVKRTDGELFKALNHNTREYIKDHPSSLIKAFARNGVQRTWDLRPLGQVNYELAFEGRTTAVADIGWLMYIFLGVMTLLALWRLWRRQKRGVLVLALLATALAASVGYSTAGGTRYRQPFEPIIVVLSMSLVAPLITRRPRFAAVFGDDLGVDGPGGPRGVGPAEVGRSGSGALSGSTSG
jgi:4-amino-4-deoxy-L-arabinose transferase-like glycosyltransferase